MCYHLCGILTIIKSQKKGTLSMGKFGKAVAILAGIIGGVLAFSVISWLFFPSLLDGLLYLINPAWTIIAHHPAPHAGPTDPFGKCEGVSTAPGIKTFTHVQVVHAFYTYYNPDKTRSVGKYAYESIDRPMKVAGQTARDPGIATDNIVIPRGSKILFRNGDLEVADDTGCDMRRAARGLETSVIDRPFVHIDERMIGEPGENDNPKRPRHIVVCVIPPGMDPKDCGDPSEWPPDNFKTDMLFGPSD